MKVLAICGSPRRGNTEAMLRRVLDGAKGAGADVELALLKDKKIEYCDGCLGCDKTGSCHVKDEMHQFYGKLASADVIVIGSPNYFDNVSGLMKTFIDRTNPLYITKTLNGKKGVAVVAGGGSEKSSKKVIATIDSFFEPHEIRKIAEIIAADVLEPNKAAQDSKIMQECFELGRKIASQ